MVTFLDLVVTRLDLVVTSDRIPQYPTTLPPPLAICIKYSSSKHSSSYRGWAKLVKGGEGATYVLNMMIIMVRANFPEGPAR